MSSSRSIKFFGYIQGWIQLKANLILSNRAVSGLKKYFLKTLFVKFYCIPAYKQLINSIMNE